MKFSDWISNCLGESPLGVGAFARSLGLSPAGLFYWTSGKCTPRPNKVLELADRFASHPLDVALSIAEERINFDYVLGISYVLFVLRYSMGYSVDDLLKVTGVCGKGTYGRLEYCEVPVLILEKTFVSLREYLGVSTDFLISLCNEKISELNLSRDFMMSLYNYVNNCIKLDSQMKVSC